MKKKILIIVAVVVGVVVLLGAGVFIGGRFLFGRMITNGFLPQYAHSNMPFGGRGMMQPYEAGESPRSTGRGFSQQGWNDGAYCSNGVQNGYRSGGRGSMMGQSGGCAVGGMQGGYMGGGRGYMMGQSGGSVSGERISLDQALEKAKAALSSYGTNVSIAEVMEFENNFYVMVKETETGRGAFELLVDPFSGAVTSEPGPNMMWNTKYGHMRFNTQTQPTEMSVEQAAEKAAAYLKTAFPAATLETDGTAFYGYVTFDYKVNGVVAGMLSVNSQTGDVWMHTWHGVFVSEKMIE